MIKITDNISYCSISGNFFYTKNYGRLKAGSVAGHKCLVNRKSGGIYYIKLSILGVRHLAHRVAADALGMNIDGLVVDHINGNTLDNSAINLRVVSKAENNKNLSINKRTKTGINGVYIKNGKFYARITVNKENIHLGVFCNMLDAASARKSALNNYCFHENHGRK